MHLSRTRTWNSCRSSSLLFWSGTWRMQMDLLVLITHRQQITTKTQIGMRLETVTRRSRPRAAGRWSTFVVNTWRNGDPTAITPLFPSGHQIDCIAFGQERLDKAEVELATNLVRVFNSARNTIMFLFVSDSRLRDVGEEMGTGTIDAQDGTWLRRVGQ